MSMVVPFSQPERSWRASLLIFLVDCWSKKIIIGPERHCILVHLGSLPTSGLALLAFLIGTFRPIHGPPILVLQKYAKLPSVVTRTNTQTSLDCTVLVMSLVVPSRRNWEQSRYRDCSLTSAGNPDSAVSAITEPKFRNRHDHQNTNNVIRANNALLKGILLKQPILELINQTKHTTSYVSLLTHGRLCAGAGLCASQGEQNFHEYYAWGVCESDLAPSGRALMEIPDSAKPPLGTGISRFLVLAWSKSTSHSWREKKRTLLDLAPR